MYKRQVVDLATAEDGGQYFMLLRGGEDEDHMCGRFLQGFQEGIEGCGGEHVHLIDDEHLVFAQLRWDARLLHQRLDVLYRVIGGSIQFEDVQGALLVERQTTLTLIAGLALCRRILAVDSLGEDTCAGGLSHTPGTAEQVGMCQFPALDGILQCGSQG